MRPPRSSRQRYQAFVQDYKHRRLDAVAEAADKPKALPSDNGNAPSALALAATDEGKGKRRQYLRAYLRWLWPHRFAIGAVFVLALVAAGMEMIEPLFMRFIVDRVLLNKALDAAARIARLNATGALCSRAKKYSADAADRGNRPSCALRPALERPRLAGMANEQAIHSVGATLRSYLESTYPPHLRTSYPCEFHLASSNEVAKLDTLSTRSGATLLLYLYHITVSGESQNAALPTGVGSQSRQALSVDLHYLLNVVAPLAVTENVVLAFAMRQLALRPVLDGASMAEWGWRPDESVQLIPETVPLNDFANVFSAMSQHYRTSALYVARGVQIDLDPGVAPPAAPAPPPMGKPA